MFPGQVVVCYNSSAEKFMRKAEGVAKFTGHGLRRIEDICLYRREFDVLYTPYWWSGIGIEGLPQVHFIPDVAHVFYPTHQKKLYVEHFILGCKHAMGISKYIVTPSEYTKRTLVDQFDFPEKRIRVVYHGVHPIFLDESNGGSRPDLLPQGAADYLFFPASQLRRKNHRVLLDALVILRKRYAFEPHCVLTGDMTPNPMGVDVRLEILKRGLSTTVHHLGTVSLAELKYLYANAKALVFPSFFEGFGIPLLEALTVGCPVIASNRTSIPEVAGEAALYFDPHDSGDLADALFRFYQDPGIAERLVAAGKKRAGNFSEARQVLETRAVLQDAYLASKHDLGRRPAIVNEFGNRPPEVTVVVLFQRSLYREIVRELEKLIEEVNRAVEVIWIVCQRDAHLLSGLQLPGRRITYENNFHTTIMNAAQTASGRFVFFSECNVVPLSSFVFFLIERRLSGELDGDFLHGEVYFKDSRADAFRSLVHFYATQEDLERDYCFHYLPFVVRKEVLVTALSRLQSPPGSFPDLAVLLFDACKRKRVFVPVCAKITGVRPRETPQSAMLFSRMTREFVRGTAIFRLARNPRLRYLVLRSFDTYVGLPQWVRGVFRLIARPIWNKPRSE